MTDNKVKPLTEKCKDNIKDLFGFLHQAVCENNDEVSEAFQAFQFVMQDGVVFRGDRGFNQRLLEAADIIVSNLGPSIIEISHAKKIMIEAFVEIYKKNGNQLDFYDEVKEKIEENVNAIYGFVHPCVLFDFYCEEKYLKSDYVSVVGVREILDDPDFPKRGRMWNVAVGDKFDVLYEPGIVTFIISDLVWHVKVKGSKENVRIQSRWMIDVFTSFVRLAVKPADYCHRPTIGEVETGMGYLSPVKEIGLTYTHQGISGGAMHGIKKYKVDKVFFEEFHSHKAQQKLDSIYKHKRGTLADRIYHGLGWLSRGRQSVDASERLLHFFTALESLISNQDQFSPVVETICRFTSVILSKDISERKNIYLVMKNLYRLRSTLVHGGVRSAHALNVNNIQHVTEICYQIIIYYVDMDITHKDFLSSLRDASHGSAWELIEI